MDVKRWLAAGLVAAIVGVVVSATSPAWAEDPPCYDCHDDFPTKMKTFKVTHDPAASGDCTACHVDHGDKEELILAREGADLCYECHDTMGQGASVHAPVSEGKCTGCHNPHGSANKKLLVAAGRELCDRCHDKSPVFRGKVSHAAVDDGCSDCHRPHSSENKNLLTKNLTLERLALFDPKQAELCFDCHDLESFTKAQSEETGFRIGNQNLHALHLMGGATPNKYGILKKKEGQTCFACHLPHTADQEKLIRTEYQCTGTFCYTMRFLQNSQGGTCIVGCHKPKAYIRDGMDPNATAGATPLKPAVP